MGPRCNLKLGSGQLPARVDADEMAGFERDPDGAVRAAGEAVRLAARWQVDVPDGAVPAVDPGEAGGGPLGDPAGLAVGEDRVRAGRRVGQGELGDPAVAVARPELAGQDLGE